MRPGTITKLSFRNRKELGCYINHSTKPYFAIIKVCTQQMREGQRKDNILPSATEKRVRHGCARDHHICFLVICGARRAKLFNAFPRHLAGVHLQQACEPDAQWKYYIVYVVWLTFDGVFIYSDILETANLFLPRGNHCAFRRRLVQVAGVAHLDKGKNVRTPEIMEDIDGKGSDSYCPHELSRV
ncbi:hypothetical protein FIBSPDRAFT_889868 [Athelia psychrophila]|uniref:Uncharacterized protein n=1 Tax=Athelia psychrophila TaxID=1759441 RepID=A0A166LHT1_9AGAM|nr:hypothetical protein FIBSPDRAFT_889868 [Fibularhizoctonia sp. CBS 109695]